MLYFDDVVDTKNLFTEEFKKKLKEQSKSLDIQKLRGHLHHYKARINDNERAFFKIEKGKVVLLYHLSHQKQDQKLKNNKRLNTYLKTTNIKLNFLDLTQFDSAFDTFQDQDEENYVENLFRDDCLTQPLSRVQWKHDHFIVLDDIQEAAINTNCNHLAYGLPGSGKSTVLEELCKEACKQQLLLQGEIKPGNEERHFFLTPHPKLARSIATKGLAVELTEYSFLCVQDLATFAKLIDPIIAMLEAQCKEYVETHTQPTARRGLQDFIQWCHTRKIFVEQPKHQDKKNPLESEDCYALLYMECKEIANCKTKKAYITSPSQTSVLENNPEARERRFNIYVQYCRENLVGSRIPPEDDEGAAPTLDITMPSPAHERGIALGKPIGYDLNFYDFLPALLKEHHIRKIHTISLDEVHNFPKLFLSAVLSLGCKIQAAGDSDQGLYDILSPLEHIRQIFNFRAKKFPDAFKIHPFMTSYRSSQAIIQLLTQWLILQNMYFPNINNAIQDKTHPPVNTLRGSVNYFSGISAETGDFNPEIIEKYKALCADNPNMVFVVSDDKQAELLQKILGTPLVLTWDEIGGLEYKHLVIIGDIFTKFRKMLEKCSKSILSTTQKTVRPKNKKEIPAGQELLLEMHKIYVILSRAIESLDIDNVNRLQEILTAIPGIQTTCVQEVFVHTGEQKFEAESTAEETRSDWIKRCNEFIQQAFEYGIHEKKKLGFLNKAKNIFEAKGLKTRELQLSSDVVLPAEFECFLPETAFINAVLENCNTENIKKLFNKELNDLEELLFLPIQDANGNNTTLWDTIFSNEIKAKSFLLTASADKAYISKLQQIFRKFKPDETKKSRHYYMMLCLSESWITGQFPEYKELNELTKQLVLTTSSLRLPTESDELFYATYQRELELSIDNKTQAAKLHAVSSPVLFKAFMQALKSHDEHTALIMLPMLTRSEINTTDENGSAPLMVAATIGNQAIVKKLLPFITDGNQLNPDTTWLESRPVLQTQNPLASPGISEDDIKFIHLGLKQFSSIYASVLLGRRDAALILLTKITLNGNFTTLWDMIFSNKDKTEIFLRVVVKESCEFLPSRRETAFREILFSKFTRIATEMSTHYYAMLTMSDVWMSEKQPEYIKINQLTKELIGFVSFKHINNTPEELYYAMYQHELYLVYLRNDNKPQTRHLFELSYPVLVKYLIRTLNDTQKRSAEIETIAEMIISKLTEDEINQAAYEGITPLTVAIERGHKSIVVSLLPSVYDLSTLSIAFRDAQKFGRADIAKIIEERGLGLNLKAWQEVTSSSTALHPIPLLLAKRDPKERTDITQLDKECTDISPTFRTDF